MAGVLVCTRRCWLASVLVSIAPESFVPVVGRRKNGFQSPYAMHALGSFDFCLSRVVCIPVESDVWIVFHVPIAAHFTARYQGKSAGMF
jgi:hypothetical protein